MTKRILLSAASAIALLAGGHAGAREFGDIYSECGLGAMIAPNNSGVAAVTNVTWDLGSTAISSNATSADTCAGGKKKTAAFIVQQYAQLENDLARGQGRHLTALLEIAGCPTGAAQSLREAFAVTTARPGYAEQSRFDHAEALYDGVLQASCAAG